MPKYVAIDTNLLLDDEKILFKLSGSYEKILIPLTVLKELDDKKFQSDFSYSARKAIRAIIEFKNKFPGRLEFSKDDCELSKNDLKIIEAAKQVNADVATKDMSMSIIAEAKGLNATLYDVMTNDLFDPYITVSMPPSLIEVPTQAILSGKDYYRFILVVEQLSNKTINTDSWSFVLIEDTGIVGPIVYALNPLTQEAIRIDNDKKYIEFDIDGTSIRARDPYQNCAFYALKEAPHVLITGSWGTGKTLLATSYVLEASKKKTFITRPPIGISSKYDLGYLPGPQPLYAKILTPTGWTTMGEIKVGDLVIGNDGKPSKVRKTFDMGIKPVYKIETTNGGITHACGDHLWSIKESNKKQFELLSTVDMKNKKDKTTLFLPGNDIVEFSKKEDLPIPPYTLGVLLGDGHFSTKVTFTSVDDELIERVKSEIEDMGLHLTNYNIIYNIVENSRKGPVTKKVKVTNTLTLDEYTYNSVEEASEKFNIKFSAMYSRCACKKTINGMKYEFTKDHRYNSINKKINALNLNNTRAINKFIPDIYKYSSIENRIALLQGLMDTDGTIKESTGEQSFTTISYTLAMDLIELCRSLGINATYYTRNRVGNKQVFRNQIIEAKNTTYEVSIPRSNTINPFFISRKRDRVRPPIQKSSNKIKSIEYKCDERVKCISIDNDSELYITDDYIVTHNSKTEKMLDWCAGFLSALYYVYYNTRSQKSAKDGIDSSYDFVKDDLFAKRFEIIPINMIQGLSILNEDILIADEIQLLDINYTSMLMSRPTEEGKLIMLGDLAQSYSVIKPSESGLLKLLRVLPHKSIAHVDLKVNYRSELIEVATMLQDTTIA